jgi:hypothetical protein
LEATVRIENRSQLIYLLTEAAELEHSIMCCYLFAAFSLKNETREGVSDAQLRKIRGWRRVIFQIAVEEMLHLASACNILTAVGGAPQLRRPNLPISPRAYGATFTLNLAPFSIETLEQFITIEKPYDLRGGRGGTAKYELPSQAPQHLSDIFSSERNYDTQGKLYRGIEDGVAYLAQKYGENRLFIGPPEAQTADAYFPNLPGLIPVTNLSSALAAIKVIVEQGEGASHESIDSHYSKFVRIWQEYKELLSEDPDFQPSRPVLTNPHSLLPTDLAHSAEVHLVDDETTDDLCNLFDGCYELLVQILSRLFLHAEESEEELKRLARITEDLMFEVIEPLGNLLTTLPAGPSHPGRTAGPSFRLSRGASIPTRREPAWSVFQERLTELASYCQFLQSRAGPVPVLTGIREAISKYVVLLQAPM